MGQFGLWGTLSTGVQDYLPAPLGKLTPLPAFGFWFLKQYDVARALTVQQDFGRIHRCRSVDLITKNL